MLKQTYRNYTFIITAALLRYTKNESTLNIFVITTAVITESNTGKKMLRGLSQNIVVIYILFHEWAYDWDLTIWKQDFHKAAGDQNHNHLLNVLL